MLTQALLVDDSRSALDFLKRLIEANGSYADIGITVIMPISGLCRADVVP
jgi:hypothetical protein